MSTLTAIILQSVEDAAPLSGRLLVLDGDLSSPRPPTSPPPPPPPPLLESSQESGDIKEEWVRTV